jgi:hypothetical protein
MFRLSAKATGSPAHVVGAVRVANVPAQSPAAIDVFAFRPEHKPEPNNPAHPEVRSYDYAGNFIPYPPKLIRKWFREELGQACVDHR